MSTQNQSSRGFLPIIGIAAVVVAGGIGAYYYFQGHLPFVSGDGVTPLEAAAVVPETAVASSYLSTRSQDWQQISNYGTPQAREVIQKNFKQWETETFSEQGISLEKDIQPWVDGVTFAVLPLRQGTVVPDTGQVLGVVGIKNKAKAAQFVQKLKKQPNIRFEERKYQNTTITDVIRTDGNNFSFAVLGDRLAISQNSSLIEKAIDTAQGEASYADKPGVAAVMSQSLTLKNSLFNLYIPNYGEMVTQFLPNRGSDLPTNTLKQLDNVGSMVIGIAAKPQGLHLQAIAQVNPDSLTSLPSAFSGNFLSAFPGQTFMFISGKGVNQGWSTLVQESAQDQYLDELVTQVRQVFNRVNLDADREVFGWLDGEFSLGMTTLEQGGIGNLGIGGLMMLETSDRPTAEKTLEKFNQLAQSNPAIRLTQKNSDQFSVTEWTVPQQGAILSYGWLNNEQLQLILGTSWDTIEQQKKQKSLADNPNFQTIRPLLPSNNLGYFYLDIEQMANQFKAFSGGGVDADSEAILSSLQGLGLTATLPDKSTSQLDLVLSIKSTNE